MRHFYSVFAACVVSLLLFSLMQFLVSGSGAGLLKVPSGYTMQFIRLERHSSTQLKQRQLPKKPDPPQKSPAKPVSVHEHVGHDALAKPLLSMPGIPTMAFNNQPFLGRNFLMAPAAVNNDGLFDVCLIKNIKNRLGILLIIIKVLAGRHIYSSSIKMWRTDTLIVEADSPKTFLNDGEFLQKTKKFKIQVIPRALNMIVPETWL